MLRTQSSLIGRDRELDALTALIERAALGHGGLALVSGEPGIGKTRLLEEVADRASARGFAVVWGRAWELGSAPTYWPWIEVLRALAQRPGSDPASAAVLARLLPELDPARGSGAEASLPAATAVDAFALCDAVRAHLLASSAREPVLVVLDDLHAADPSSLALAEFVARCLRGARLCVFGSHRDLEARLSPELDAALLRLGRFGEAWVLPRLLAGEVQALVREQTGLDDAAVARMIHDASAGNPLFVRELLRLLAARSAGGEPAAPAGVRAVIRERLALLSPATTALLQAAAIVGREFSLGVAAEVAGVTTAALDEAAAEARDADLLVDARPGRLRFSHALVAETLAADLPATSRMRMHRRAALVLEARLLDDATSVSLDEAAHHWLNAGAEVAERAVQAAERAADAAMARLAFEDAAAGYERAQGALTLCGTVDAARRAGLLIKQGEAHARCGSRTRAEPVCRAAADIAAALDDGVLLARAALALGAESSVGYADPPLCRLLERALGLLPAGDGPWRAQAMARLASARQPELDPSQPMELAYQAIAMARRLGDPQLLLPVLHSALGALVDYAPPRARAALNAEVVGMAMAASDRPRELRARTRLMFDCAALGDLDGFEAALAGYEAALIDAPQPRYQWVPLMFRSMRANWEGRFEEADRLEREARALSELARGDGPPVVPARNLGKALLMADVDALDRARLELAVAFPGEQGFDRLFTACVRAQQGRTAEAIELLAPLPPDRLTALSHEIHTLEVLSMIAWNLRDRQLAARILPQLLAHQGTFFTITGIAYSLHDTVDRALMLLLCLQGQPGLADRHAEAALALCTRISAAPLLARLRHDWASMLAERGPEHLPRARTLALAAREAAEALGQAALAARCRELEARLAGEAEPNAESRPSAGPASATPTPAPTPVALRMELEGEYWCLHGFGELCRVPDHRGIQLLARLIDHPRSEIHVLELSKLSNLEGAVDAGDAGELLDPQARSAYAARVRELTDELEEAVAWNDPGRRERLEAELEALRGELSRAAGLGGRERRAGSVVERARVNVRRRIALALQRIAKTSPAIGRHLNQSIRTGTYCVYEP